MVRVNENYWIRYSLNDGSYPYYLKRIVNCDGSRVQPNWDLYMSNGTGIPPRTKDLYGNGGDDREHVADVPPIQFVRWSTEDPPAGSGVGCFRETGDSCRLFACASWQNAIC